MLQPEISPHQAAASERGWEGIRFLFGARGGAPPQAGRARPPGAWPCPGGAPIETNGRFRWAVEGCWGLQTGYGVGKRPSSPEITHNARLIRGDDPR
jgi:hypothetical protein